MDHVGSYHSRQFIHSVVPENSKQSAFIRRVTAVTEHASLTSALLVSTG